MPMSEAIVDLAAHSTLVAWESFYIIVGSSAGALTGLQFVVITLTAESSAGGPPEIAAFGTPTVLHFCAALLVSALLSAPWSALSARASPSRCVARPGSCTPPSWCGALGGRKPTGRCWRTGFGMRCFRSWPIPDSSWAASCCRVNPGRPCPWSRR